MLAKEYEMKEEIKYSSKAIPLRGCDHPKFKWIDAALIHLNLGSLHPRRGIAFELYLISSFISYSFANIC